MLHLSDNIIIIHPSAPLHTSLYFTIIHIALPALHPDDKSYL